MKLLVVAPSVPYKGVPHAGGVFLLRHLEFLHGCGVEVELLALDERVDAGRAPGWLRLVTARPAQPQPRSLRRQADRVQHRLRGAAALPHALRALEAAGLVARAETADLVEVHGPDLAHVVPLLRQAGIRTPVTLLEHDVAHQASARRLVARGSRRDRIASRLLGRLHRRTEGRALQAADLVLVFKASDARLIGQLGVTTPVRVLAPWLDPPRTDPLPREADLVLFTGALWRDDNADAATWLLDEIWPLVLASRPGARLALVGAGPGQTLLARADNDAVLVPGKVPDLGPWYERASVFVAPLRSGGGLKFKVPQAMLHRLPVVATSIAGEGVVEAAPAGALWAVRDTADGLAEALVTALQDPAAAAETGRAAGEWCAQHWSFAASEHALLDDYAVLTGASRPLGPGDRP